MFWAKLGGGLTIFGTVFAVATFLVSAGTLLERLILAAAVVSASALLYQAVLASFKHQLDWRVSALVMTTFVATIAYGLVVVYDRDAEIDRLNDIIDQSADVDRSSAESAGPSAKPSTASPQVSKPTPSTDGDISGEESSAENLRKFDSSDVEQESSGTLTTELDHHFAINLYRWEDYLSGHLRFTADGVSGIDGTSLSLVSASAPTTFPTCRDEGQWSPAANWTQLSRGSFLCVRLVDGRRALIRIDQYPNFDSNRPEVTVTGVVWVPIVDR